MARVWVLMGVVAVGCGAPAPPPPPSPNAAPRIASSVPSQVRSTFFNSSACPTMNPEFSLAVEELDVTDVLSSLWFIDGTNTQPFIPSSVPGQSGSVIRLVSSPRSVAFKSALANLTTGTTSVLTVYVTDGNFNEVIGGEVSATRLARDGGAPEPAIIDSFTWTLDIEACP